MIDERETLPASDDPVTGEDGKEGALGDRAKAVQEILVLFGGIRPMAAKLGVAGSTVQGWKERGAIPASRHEEIREKAKELGLALDETLLASADGTLSKEDDGNS
ncbi:MAG: hypothetical protein R3245_05655, partial [Kiloniellales bacterium]|nr:hypothetical protein [Kiloniellales bacterium]